MWLDWPAGILKRGEVAHNVYFAFDSMRQAESGQLVKWTAANPALWQIVGSVMALREEQHG